MVATQFQPTPIALGTATLHFDRPLIMGILNLTPDSFFDGGAFTEPQVAMNRIQTLIDEGADIIDIGAESTRPGADQISPTEQIQRLTPVLSKFKQQFSIPLSIDTCQSEVAEYALQMGADIINDVSGLSEDPELADVVAKHDAALVIMHRSDTSKTMQNHTNYQHPTQDIIAHIKARTDFARGRGVTKIIVDPGIGFGKTPEHNLALIQGLSDFQRLEYPILIGASHKSFIGFKDQSAPNQRLGGSIAAHILAAQNGAHIIRCHDIFPTRQALHISMAIQKASYE